MKLRFHKNSLRFRLSQPEVTELSEQGSLLERFEFPNDGLLSFSLELGESEAALFEHNEVRVIAPKEEIASWADSDREGIEFESGPIRIAIEKDFQCLHKAGPADADAFPNPMLDKF